jgi:hypothetical protein
MRTATVLLMVFPALGCGREVRPASNSKVPDGAISTQQPSALRERADSELMDHLRRLSSQLAGDTIHLYSPQREKPSAMTGREVSAADYPFFRPFYPDMEGQGEVFAVGYFAVGSGLTAYVLRVPSQYASSAIALWIHNDAQQYWLPPVNVADAFGDEGWSFQQDAWLVDRDHDGYRDLVQRRTDWKDGRTVSDSLSWRFWQARFGHLGWRQGLVNRSDSIAFSLQKTSH